MNSKQSISSIVVLVILSSLALSPAAFAKDGNSTLSERSTIARGMSQQKVTEVLGKPLQIRTYALDPDTSWIYGAQDAYGKDPRYQVNFGKDGAVTSARLVDLGTD